MTLDGIALTIAIISSAIVTALDVLASRDREIISFIEDEPLLYKQLGRSSP
jgi:hypothetical protein